MDRKIKILKGRAKSFDLFIQNEQSQPKDITGWSIIRLKIAHDGGCVTKYAPKSTGIDEVQRLDLKLADAGSYKLKFKDETTPALLFSDNNTTIQTALNTLFELSGVVVSNVSAGIFDITFSGADAKREQPLITIIESTLKLVGSDVAATNEETVKGEEASGIEVVQAIAGHIRVSLSNDDVAALDVANDQNIDLYVRLGADDLDLDPSLLRDVLDVEEVGC